MDILVKAFETIANNKEFGTLMGILYYSIKQNNSMKVQQATCLGKFGNQELKIQSIKETAEESKKKAIKAEETADKAFTCVENISKTVEDVRDDWKKYIAGKHGEPLTKTDQKETNNGLKA